jgi:hypothetical protein
MSSNNCDDNYKDETHERDNWMEGQPSLGMPELEELVFRDGGPTGTGGM